MAGHSKWKNIQRRKNAQDSKRGKIFMRLAKEIFVAAKEGGGDPETNRSLRLMIDKAKAANMPNENIERAIKKATGTLEGVSYEEITYEGYGPGGVAVMVEVVTDNKNRSAAEIRHAFSKQGGNLGESGCVSFMFDRKGLFVIDKDTIEIDEEELMLDVIEAGAEELESNEETFEIYTEPDQFSEVKKVLLEKDFNLSTAGITRLPQTTAEPQKNDALKMLYLIDVLEENDDVQDVYHNLEVDEKVYDEYLS
ncbi:YebC/PmpR family DNA-binding transcriptional regulator [Pseudalkalibacillus decolorationis]|uniref:YebC/PmpR family DNA-binding transcriptional regulator n=1 Tax=Pseudalkalibacillus decolorationis TaxID=163879 RepID=UPI00214876FB|nr:YebC/PmpR family DNA-binding transcriptional regulator [Pseudalkalibacillus decolorationis]